MHEQQAPLLVTDDREAYNTAMAHGIPVTRTLRILEIAAERGLLDLPTIITRLRSAGFYMPEDVVEEMLARDTTRKATAPTPSLEPQDI
jgi:predicted nucleic acid-binding protein